ncbi:MAG TPA: glycoside hydrolase family 18 protein, partial [Planctomicrobium sp.]|nr:glycoside hydrolase family 18 protein [Planctomicrobium sp.]
MKDQAISWIADRQEPLPPDDRRPWCTFNKAKALPVVILLAVRLMLLVICLGSLMTGQELQASFRVVGYLPDYRARKFDPDQAAFLTDLILFAAEPTPDGGIDLGNLKNAPWESFETARSRHGVRLFLCLGGWGRSDHFSRAVLSPAARTRLVISIVNLLRQKRLDGLDLDWEHPKGAAEQAAYAILLEELKNAFRPHGLKLSLTIAPWKEIPSRGYAAADWIQLMCYDYGQRHSTFEQAKKDVQTWIDKGIPPEKLVLGLPFYGRNIEDRKKA